MFHYMTGLAILGWLASILLVKLVPLMWVQCIGGISFMVCAAIFVASTSMNSEESNKEE